MVTVRMILLANVDGQVKSQGHEVRGMAVVLDNDNVDREGLASPVYRPSSLGIAENLASNRQRFSGQCSVIIGR